MKHKLKKCRTGKRHNPAKDANYLPVHQAKAFQHELCDLISELSKSEGFKGSYLGEEFLSKYADPHGVSPDERRSAAITKWLSCERRNARTNQHLLFEESPFFGDDLVRKVKSIIKEVLGPLVYPHILTDGGHTNGASTRVKRDVDSAFRKYTGEAHVTENALKHWLAVASSTRLNEACDLQIVPGSVLFTVPKKTHIDRVACKEPEVNMWLQRSVGNHIRRKLKNFGIDLNDQTVNQRLCKTALEDGLATIDLSAASDSVTRQLVFNLLPFEWWSLLDDLRVPTTTIDGETHTLEMFSSMGNGFTFELESLIFYAITRATMWKLQVNGRVSVYGDDIICPAKGAGYLVKVLNHFGFKVNTEKSFWQGPFRESCGVHYHNGLDVTPFYLRDPVRRLTDVIRLLNRLFYWDARDFGVITHPTILAFHSKWAQVVPSRLHGGQDPNETGSLVTGDKPRSRLSQRVKPLSETDELGRYVHWFCGRGSPRVWYTRHGLPTGVLDLESEGSYPSRQGKFFTTRNLSAVNTAWEPYMLHTLCNATP